MTRSRPAIVLALALVIPLSALAVTACGGGGAATTSPPSAPSAPSKTWTTPARTATPRVANSRLEWILVGSAGRTPYLFNADLSSMRTCTGTCASAWPPLLAAGTPIAGTGLTASELATITRSGGSQPVTYNGHPVDLYIGDKKAGEVTGHAVPALGAVWFALTPAGNQISTQPTTSGGGYGY